VLSQAPLAPRWILYWGALLLLFLVEQTALLPLGASEVFWRTHRWTWLVLAVEKGVPTTFIIGVAGATLLSWETFRSALRSLVAESDAGGFNWLFIHLAVVAALLGWTGLCRANRMFPSPYWEIWIWVRVALELLTLASWAVAALPPSFWLRWFVSNPSAFVAGTGFALITKMLGHYTEALWWLFQSSTLLTVATLLRLCGQTVITGPAKAQIGTPNFSARWVLAVQDSRDLASCSPSSPYIFGCIGAIFDSRRYCCWFPSVSLLNGSSIRSALPS
jgi:hypothetical protein